MVQMNRILGKPLWNAKKILAWMVDRSEIQVLLAGVSRHHDHSLGIREGSADGARRGIAHSN